MKSYKITIVALVMIFAGLNSFACDERLNGHWDCSQGDKGVTISLNWDAKTKVLTKESDADDDIDAVVMDGKEKNVDGLKTKGECLKIENGYAAQVTLSTSSFINLTMTSMYTPIDDSNMLLTLLPEEDGEDSNISCVKL